MNISVIFCTTFISLDSYLPINRCSMSCKTGEIHEKLGEESYNCYSQGITLLDWGYGGGGSIKRLREAEEEVACSEWKVDLEALALD